MKAALPAHLFTKLAEFQKQGVYWGAMVKGGRCLIADEPGLGKTIQSISVAAVYRQEWPFLVISPSSARYHWENEILASFNSEDERNWIERGQVQVMLSGSQPIRKDIKALIISYDLVDRIHEKLTQVGFQVVIADECHMLRNQNTKRSKATLPILRAASRAILLSGTPALSRPKELWSQLNVINPDSWKSYDEFLKRYTAFVPPTHTHTSLTSRAFVGGSVAGTARASLMAPTRKQTVRLTSRTRTRRTARSCTPCSWRRS